MVGGIHYREPGIWVKAATTLDVLTGGRAWLGLGAAWNREESEALGFEFPPLGVRFELLEETLRIAHEMFEGETGSQKSLAGKHYQPKRLLNSPQSISRPRVPIMIGGGGEQKTLRLVAEYADATNVFGGPEHIARKYQVLKGHCDAIGRRFEDIERSTLQGNLHLTRDGAGGSATPGQIVDYYGELADAGAQHVLFSVRDVDRTETLELFGETVIPQLRNL
jgi:alkanesulfonate monooxygenase SsuD/methylene tetrahydromethanopterin reductase-like flavin-dependent oxidoreductase (luciferase family)